MTENPQNTPSNLARIVATDVLYEVKTKKFLGGYAGNEFKDPLGAPTDMKKIEERVKNEGGWKWLNETWQNDGADAWEYSTRERFAPKTDSKHWSFAEGMFDTVKRRRWYRKRVKLVTEEERKKLTQQWPGVIVAEIKHDELHNRISSLKQNFGEECKTISTNTNKPNILLLGGSGAGKSSLVNAVFGKPLAEIGEGKPITQQYTKFEGKNSPVTIYDSKGIEHGYIETGFVADTRKFFKKLRQQDATQHVHVVWYVIDLTQARFQPFEANFCRDELSHVPIIFVFNKADTVDQKVKDVMIQTVADFKLPNCMGLFATVANQKNFDSKTCPQCQSLKIRKRLKEGTCTIMCKECKYTVTMEKTAGINELSRQTLAVLPELVQSVYIHSQSSKLLANEFDAKKMIDALAHDMSLTNSDRVLDQLVKLVSDLCKLYELEAAATMLQQLVKKRYDMFYHEQRLQKKASMFLSDMFAFKKPTLGESLIVITGLEVCSALINLKRELLTASIKQKKIHTISSTDSLEETASDEEENDWYLVDQLVARHVSFSIDSDSVDLVFHELAKVGGSVKIYLDRIALDGRRNYKIVEVIKPPVVDDDEEMTVPLYSYQDMANASKAKDIEPAPTTIPATSAPVAPTIPVTQPVEPVAVEVEQAPPAKE
jgi:GTP-binding protein EngB required for normal cell division